MYKGSCDDVIPLLDESHYELDEKPASVTFTDEGDGLLEKRSC